MSGTRPHFRAWALAQWGTGLTALLPLANAQAETLQLAWTIAAKADPSQDALHAETGAARAELRAARALRLPAADVSAAYIHVGDPPSAAINLPIFGVALPISGDKDVAVGGASLSYPVYNGGQVRNAIAGARSGSVAARLIEQAGARDLKLAVAKAYFDVLRSEHALAVYGDGIASLTAHVRDVRNFAAQSLLPRTDVLAAELLLADLRQQQVQAETRTALAQANYNRRLGRALDAPVALDEPAPAVAMEPSALLEPLLSQGAGREEIAALAHKAQALRSRAKVAQAAALPTVLVGSGYVYIDTDTRPGQGSWFAGLTMKWRLFDGGKAAAEADRYQLDARAADGRAKDARTLIALDIRRAWLSVRDAHDRLAVAEIARVSADENLRVSRDRFRQGVGTSAAVLDAQRERSAASLRYYLALYDRAYADIDLQRSAGVL